MHTNDSIKCVVSFKPSQNSHHYLFCHEGDNDLSFLITPIDSARVLIYMETSNHITWVAGGCLVSNWPRINHFVFQNCFRLLYSIWRLGFVKKNYKIFDFIRATGQIDKWNILCTSCCPRLRPRIKVLWIQHYH